MIYQSPIDDQGFGVEVHIGRGLPGFDIVGAPGERVRLIRARIVEMLATNGFELPPKRVTINVVGPWRSNATVAFAVYDGLRVLMDG